MISVSKIGLKPGLVFKSCNEEGDKKLNDKLTGEEASEEEVQATDAQKAHQQRILS